MIPREKTLLMLAALLSASGVRVLSKNRGACARSILLLSLICCGRTTAAGQSHVEGCQDCDFVLDHVARIGSLDDPALLSPFSVIVQQRNGRFLVAPMSDPGTVGVFEPDGSYIRSVGRHGQGPGEMRSVRAVMIWRDSVFVATRGFMHVFSPEYGYVRRIALSALHRYGYAVADDGIYVNTLVPGNVSANVVRFDHDGRRVAGAWVSSPQRRTGGSYSDLAMLATDGSQVVFAPVPSYEVARLTDGGVERFFSDARWFPSWHDSDTGFGGDGTSYARVNGLGVMPDGRIVVISARPEKPRPPSHYTDPTIDWTTDQDEYIDSQLEIWDLSRAKVVGSVRRPEDFRGSAAPGHLYSISVDPSGLVVADLWRITEPRTVRR